MKAEEFYKEFFGVKEPKENGTTINKSVWRFAEQYAELHAQKEWISVEDREPKPLIHVLVWSEKYHDEPFIGYLKRGVWKDADTNSFIDEEVTHWQPLPEPPKDVKQ